MDSSGDRGNLTSEERAQLATIRAQMEEAGTFLDGLLGGWNHGPKEEYQRVEEVAKAVADAKNAASSLSD